MWSVERALSRECRHHCRVPSEGLIAQGSWCGPAAGAAPTYPLLAPYVHRTAVPSYHTREERHALRALWSRGCADAAAWRCHHTWHTHAQLLREERQIGRRRGTVVQYWPASYHHVSYCHRGVAQQGSGRVWVNFLSLLCFAGAVTCDAHHMTDPHPDGLGVSTCIKLALKDGGVDPDEVRFT